jgi:hypothetical protein
MIEIEWGLRRKARFWWNELPPASFVATKTIEREVDVRARSALVAHSAAVEVLVPHGAMASYGLLGVEVEPADSSFLTIKVGVSRASGPPLPKALAEVMDDVRIGLPAEYAEAVAEGAAKGFARGISGCGGVLSFRCAAHGQVGSNVGTFSALAEVLVHLPWIGKDQRATPPLAELLRSVLAPR